MRPFEFQRADTIAAAARASLMTGTKLVAGGTNLLDLMKEHVETPAMLVDISRLPLAAVETLDNGIRVGALARMSDVASHEAVRREFPAISQALLLSASPQLRNMATIGGNLMQRTRCPYFRDVTFRACNKRTPGSGCSSITGDHRTSAILGTSENCIATHPSDLAVALIVLDAVVNVRSEHRSRLIAFAEFHLLPGTTPHRENALRPGEIIVSVDIPYTNHARNSAYLKIRDRASFEFALVSAAVGLDIRSAVIRSARVALGGIGTKPWRCREAEAVLVGSEPVLEVFRRAADSALLPAKPLTQNAFKVELAKKTLIRALQNVAGGS